MGPGQVRPSPRVGASLTYSNNILYLFGGHDENNEKINDFWKYDGSWT